MRILWNSYIDENSSWTAYSEDANYPVSNLYDTRLSRVYRSNGLVSTEYVQIGEASTVPEYFAMVNHNISSSATISLVGGTSSGMSTASWTQTLTWSSYTLVSTITSTAVCTYYKLKVVGLSTATQSYIEIGYLYLGDYLQLPFMKPSHSIKDETTAKITVSDGGQAYGDDGYNYRAPTIEFPYLTHTERASIRTMFASVKNYKPVVAVIWESNTSAELPMYSIIDQKNLEFKRTEDTNYPWSLSLQLREIF